MKKISCVGYHGTGSGVIDDLFREFDNVCQSKTGLEVRVLQDPDGISDLEFHLVENPDRMGGSVAIKRFLKFVERSDRTYSYVFGKKWREESIRFVDSIKTFYYNGYSSCDLLFLSSWQRFKYKFRRGINRLMPSKLKKPTWYNYFPKICSYHARLTEEDFLEKTRAYVDKLSAALNTENKEFVLLDQILSACNPSRYTRYVNDLKVIVVDRDPRDLYINHFKCKDHRFPKDPYEFCTYYRDIRKMVSEYDPSEVLFVNFADMIYHYDTYVKKVADFVGIDLKHHVNPKKFFNPDISIRGTQMWKAYPQYAEAVKIIEQNLPEYLYPYPEQN